MYLIWKVFYRGLERCFTNSKKNVRYAFVVILIVCHPIKSASSPPPPVVASTPFSWSAFLFVLCRSMDYCIKKKKTLKKMRGKKAKLRIHLSRGIHSSATVQKQIPTRNLQRKLVLLRYDSHRLAV